MERENVCEKFGHNWKIVQKQKQTTDGGTTLILFFKCRICGATFNTADDDEKEFEEKDYESKETYDRDLVD